MVEGLTDASSPPEEVRGSIPAADLRVPILRALAHCGPGQFPTLAGQLARLFCKVLDASLEESKGGDPTCHYFVPALDRLHFKAMQTPDCFVMHESDRSHRTTDSALNHALSTIGNVPLLLCATEEKARQLSREIAPGRSVILDPSVLGRILTARTDALSVLREAVRRQIHPLRLHPYDTSEPATGSMFFGRELEADVLLYSEAENFIITGPSKIGKTSMVMQLLWRLRRLRDPRLAQTFYISFQHIKEASPDEIARHFARVFRDNDYTRKKLLFEELRNFVGTLRAQFQGALTLILDEVDAVCHTSLIPLLAEFTRDGTLRLIVLGRGALRTLWLAHQSSGFSRFRELRPTGLPRTSALALVCDILSELGFTFADSERFQNRLLQLTGRQPFLLQHYAQALLEMGLSKGGKELTVEMLEKISISDSFVDFGRLRSHLNDLQTPQARLVATYVLEWGDQQRVSVDSVRTLLRERGLAHETETAARICEDLVINHLLRWDIHGFKPPRWDLCNLARHHLQTLRDLRADYLAACRRTPSARSP